MPRLAADAYWRAHAIRADRLARALAARERRTRRMDVARRIGRRPAGNLPRSAGAVSRAAIRQGPGFCCVCGQPVYRFGWHRDLWDAGPNRRAEWHTACVVAWRLWNAPSDHDRDAAAPAGAALRADRRAAVEDRRDRPPGAAVSRLARAARHAVARRCCRIGACPTFRSSTAMCTPPNAPRRRSIAQPRAGRPPASDRRRADPPERLRRPASPARSCRFPESAAAPGAPGRSCLRSRITARSALTSKPLPLNSA